MLPDDKSMGLRHIFHAIFIWPVLLLLRGVGSPFIALGQLFRWLFYSRRSSITSGTTPAYYYGDDGSSTADGDNNTIPSRQGDFIFGQHGRQSSGENLKFRNRLAPSSQKGLTSDDVHHGNFGGGPSTSVNGDPHVSFPPVPKNLPATFYAINVPPKALEGVDNPLLVFEDKINVLKEVKKYKGARFKSFSTEQDAINYSKCVPEPFSTPVKSALQNEDTAGNSPHPAMLEKSNLKAPKASDLVKLRKCIEAGDYTTVYELISNNPRFLISCGDTPSILHEGTRYNALHVSSKSNQPEIIKLLIQTIEDQSFFLKLYGQSQDDVDVRNLRVQKLLDLYLNTPDKGPCETPLHFACKFGHKECVEVLISHPLTDPNLKNKFGETPDDLICRRVDKPSQQLQNDIREYLLGRRYVPLYRDEDNIVSPTVGMPCSPTFSTDIYSSHFAALPTSPFSPETALSPKSPYEPQAVVKAFAGPMSPSQADNFRKLWRSPYFRNEQREDHEKGYERIGRDLALQKNIRWSEYWEFLDEFTDLSKPEGIQKLESYLQKQSLAVNVQSSLEAIQQSTNHSPSPRLTSVSNRLQSMKNDLFSDVDDYENRPKDNDISFGESSLGNSALSPPTTSQTKSAKPSPIQVEEMDVSPPFENGTTIQQNQHDSPEKKELSFREENLEEIMNTLAKDFGTKLIIMSPEDSSDDSHTKKSDLPVNQKVNKNMNCLFSLKNEISDMLSAVQNEEPLSVSFTTQASCDKPTYPCLSPMLHVPASPKSSTTTETVLLNVKSPNKLIAQINAMPAKTPPELKNPLKVFIQGPVATKLDVDVQRCLKNIPVDSEEFPYTAKWLNLINTFSEKEQKSLPSPAKAYGKEARSRDGTPVLKSHTVRRLEPMSLFKSPSTAI